MAATAPAPSPAPAPVSSSTRPRLSGFQPLDERIKELTSSQGELLGRIQSLKLEVQTWRSNLEAQVKTCQNELLEAKEGLNSEVQHLKSIRSAIQEEKDSFTTPFRNLEESNAETEQARQTQDQELKIDDAHTEQQTAMQA
ncbi:hypothetical protein BRADI_1g18230v3 [Brachypodium distachyon]|uniref:Uncharacterized protein n=1 Tax=Brachypodium distachyon TaxID=15368 RepID=A0A2K2DJX9_BRADI|nr:hypothetical protein BRADI_1g18230v3 [Brachypodium distachyon]